MRRHLKEYSRYKNCKRRKIKRNAESMILVDGVCIETACNLRAWCDGQNIGPSRRARLGKNGLVYMVHNVSHGVPSVSSF